MCAITGKPPAQVCTLADLTQGNEFHMPDGERWMVVSETGVGDDMIVVNIGNGPTNPYGDRSDRLKGLVTPMHGAIKLGFDHQRRLYASTALNDWYDPTPPAPPAPIAFTTDLKADGIDDAI